MTSGSARVTDARKRELALEKKIKELEGKLEAVTKDREKFRTFMKYELKRQMECMVKNNHWAPQQIVERMVSSLQGVEQFYLW